MSHNIKTVNIGFTIFPGQERRCLLFLVDQLLCDSIQILVLLAGHLTVVFMCENVEIMFLS